ncbi:hypothetical protein G5I_09885 [Acromyrmex echinatior]|uniref:Uncharacterized protein n=1 Tax=Acromyrmex echinatior TaxID=103372 RepID=F4WVE7_ACREC|nr:hypothetical protein G5I_09885 [Acromyrmex echinatior]
MKAVRARRKESFLPSLFGPVAFGEVFSVPYLCCHGNSLDSREELEKTRSRWITQRERGKKRAQRGNNEEKPMFRGRFFCSRFPCNPQELTRREVQTYIKNQRRFYFVNMNKSQDRDRKSRLRMHLAATGGKHVDPKDVKPEVTKRKGVLGRWLREPNGLYLNVTVFQMSRRRYEIKSKKCKIVIGDADTDNDGLTPIIRYHCFRTLFNLLCSEYCRPGNKVGGRFRDYRDIYSTFPGTVPTARSNR